MSAGWGVEDGFLPCCNFGPYVLKVTEIQAASVVVTAALSLSSPPPVCSSLLLFCFSLYALFFLSCLGFPFSPCVPIFLCCFSCCPSDEYRSPWLLYSTVPRTTFIYICSWNQDGKNSLKAMEIVREGSIVRCALLSWIAKRWKPRCLELTFPMSHS